MNPDGSEPKSLTDSTADDTLPEVTPDGRYIVFLSLRPGSSQEWRMEQVWRMDIDGSNPKQLSAERNGVGTVCLTPDGHWVIYGTVGDVLRKVSIDGGTPTKLTDKVEHYPEVSPDGRMLAYISVDDQTKRPKITITTLEGGTLLRTFDMPGTTVSKFRWSHDGQALIYVKTRNGVSNLWNQPLDGGAPKQLTNFTSDLIYRFAYSRDGKQLALARGNVSRDAVMISEAK
jgi:Tol biopolymer transport system component